MNLNGLFQTSKMEPGMEQVGSQNGAAKRTSLAKSDNGKDIIQRTEMNTNNSSSDDRLPKTQVFQGANNNDLDVERTQFLKPGLSTNDSIRSGRETQVFQSANSNLVERTQFVKPGQATNNSNGNARVPMTQIVRGANKNGLVERTQFVEVDDDSETALSMNDITDIVQGLSGLTQYFPLLSVAPEVHSLPPPLVHQLISWNLSIFFRHGRLIFVYW